MESECLANCDVMLIIAMSLVAFFGITSVILVNLLVRTKQSSTILQMQQPAHPPTPTQNFGKK